MRSCKNKAREKFVAPLEKDRRSPLYYGWYIVGASFVISMVMATAAVLCALLIKEERHLPGPGI